LDYSAFTLPIRVFKQVAVMARFIRHTWATHARPELMRAATAAKQQPGFQTSRILIEIALDVGYMSSSHFAHVFRRVVKVAPHRVLKRCANCQPGSDFTPSTRQAAHDREISGTKCLMFSCASMVQAQEDYL